MSREKDKTRAISITLPESQIIALDNLVDSIPEYCTRSSLIAEAVSNYLKFRNYKEVS